MRFALIAIFLVASSPALLVAQAKKEPPKPKLDPKWIEQMAVLKPDEQVRAVSAKMAEFNPGVRTPLTHKIEGDAVTEVSLDGAYVADLAPIRGFDKLKKLDITQIGNSKVSDLSPLRGLKLNELRIRKAPGITDLSPLKGMPLVILYLDSNGVASLAPLRKMMTLREVYFNHCDKIVDLRPLEGLQLTFLGLRGAKELRDLTPLKGMPLIELEISNTSVTDISVLRRMAIEKLYIHGTKVFNTTPMKGMPLQCLSIPRLGDAEMKGIIKDMPLDYLDIGDASGITDLSPLAGKKLTTLIAPNGSFKELTALEGMPLKSLNLSNCLKVVDLTPLKGMPLNVLSLDGSTVKDFSTLGKIKNMTSLVLSNCKNLRSLSFLEESSVTNLVISETSVTDLAPLGAVKGLLTLNCTKTPVTDFSPLKNTKLVNITCDIKGPKDVAALKSIKTLQYFGTRPAADVLK